MRFKAVCRAAAFAIQGSHGKGSTERSGLVWPVKILAEHEKTDSLIQLDRLRIPLQGLDKDGSCEPCFKSIHKHYVINIYEHEQLFKGIQHEESQLQHIESAKCK